MTNLNLIPPERKTENSRVIKLSRWFRIVITLMVLLLVGAGVTVAGWVMLQRHAREVKDQLTALERLAKQNSDTDITGTTNSLNTTMALVAGVLGEPSSWSYETSVVISALPTGVTVTNLTLQPRHRFRLTGIADTRSSFLELDNALKTDKHLTQVTTPSTPSKRLAVPFDYSGTVLPAPTTP